MARRLQLTRLRVSGFKSFSDPVDLLIEEGLTGIVGPNGCGKSNIVEALRWVMGESSARGLRGAEMDDVIFAGSAFRAPFDLAEVVLRVKGPAPGLPGFADEEEIEVGRRIGRGAGSAYRINGREARARDVQMLFADAAAGSRSAAVVGQGQIGFIVDARPEERRRLLEEAAGIGGLHGRRREAEIKVEHTEANLARVVDLLTRQEEQLLGLKKQAREAERYRRIAAELRASEALLLKRRYTMALAASTAAAESVTAAGRDSTAAGERLAQARQGHQAIARDLERARAEHAEVAAQAARLSERVLAGTEAARRRLAEREAITRRAAEAAEAILRETARVADLEARRDAALADRDGLEAERSRLAPALERAVQAEDERARALDDAERELARHGREAAEGAARVAAARAHLEQLAQRREAAGQRLGAMQAETADLAEAAAAERLGQRRAALARLESRRADLEQEVATLQGRLEEQRATRTELEAGRQRALDRLQAAEARLKDLQARERELDGRRGLLERSRERVAARERALAELADDVASRKADLDLPARATELEDARAAQDGAAGALAEAERARASAEAEAAAAIQGEQGARGELERLGAERQALAALVPHLEGKPLVDRLTVAPTHTTALAAALGDDLLASCTGDGAARWLEPADDGAGDPPLPEGVPTLAEHVGGSPLLLRRLRQIGVVEAADGPRLRLALRPGQRLVTLTGELWRWDGLVRGEVAEAAARLRQRQRLNELPRLEAMAEAAVTRAAADREAAGARLAACAAEARAAEAALRRTEALLAEAMRAMERADGEAAALGEQTRRLEEDGAALARERAEVDGELRTLAEQLAALPDPAGLRADCAAARSGLEAEERSAATARQSLEATAAAARERAVELAGVARAVEEARGQLDAERLALEAQLREAARREATLAAAKARHEAELAELEPGLEAAEAACRAAEADRILAQGRHDATMARVGAARLERQQAQERRIGLEAEAVRAEERLAAAGRAGTALAEQLREGAQRLAEAQERRAALAAELSGLPEEDGATALTALQQELEGWESRRTAIAAGIEALQAAAAEALRAAAEAEERAVTAREALALAQADVARAGAARDAALEAAAERLGRPAEAALARILEEEGTAALDLDALEARVDKLRLARERLGAVNLRAAQEVVEAEQAIAETRAQEGELRQAVERLKRAISTLNGEARDRLRQAFETVELHFRRLFVQVFGGGRAHLRLTNLEDPQGAGLELEAMPPGKRLTHVSLLSGGEKSLTALALVFAFFLAKPAPLCVLDEVDAPLDDANVDRFVDLMATIARDTGTRFLVVTHHPLTMARMDRLYGVTMVERGVSRLVSVALDEAVEMRATA